MLSGATFVPSLLRCSFTREALTHRRHSKFLTLRHRQNELDILIPRHYCPIHAANNTEHLIHHHEDRGEQHIFVLLIAAT